LLTVERLIIFYLCKLSHLILFLLDALSGQYLLLKSQGNLKREWISGQLHLQQQQQQQQQCAALYRTRVTWKLESSKMPCLRGSRASMTMYAIFSGSLSSGLFTSLQHHHQRTGRLPFAFSQVQPQNPSFDVGHGQKVLQRPHKMCRAYFFPRGAVSLVVLLQSMLPQTDTRT
jgi:hypothetical protein